MAKTETYKLECAACDRKFKITGQEPIFCPYCAEELKLHDADGMDMHYDDYEPEEYLTSSDEELY